MLFGDVREPDQRWACHSSLRAYAELADPRLGAVGGGGGAKAAARPETARRRRPPPARRRRSRSSARASSRPTSRTRPRAQRPARSAAARARVASGGATRNPTDFHVVMGYVLSREEMHGKRRRCEARTNELQGVCVALRGRAVQLPRPVEDTRSARSRATAPPAAARPWSRARPTRARATSRRRRWTRARAALASSTPSSPSLCASSARASANSERRGAARGVVDRAAAPDAVPVHALACARPRPRRSARCGPGRVRPMEQLDAETSAVLRVAVRRGRRAGHGHQRGTTRVGLNRSAGGYGWRFVGDDAELRAGTKRRSPRLRPRPRFNPLPLPPPTSARLCRGHRDASATKRTARRGADAGAELETTARTTPAQSRRASRRLRRSRARACARSRRWPARPPLSSRKTSAWLLGRISRGTQRCSGARRRRRCACERRDAAWRAVRGACHVIADSGAERATRDGADEAGRDRPARHRAPRGLAFRGRRRLHGGRDRRDRVAY